MHLQWNQQQQQQQQQHIQLFSPWTTHWHWTWWSMVNIVVVPNGGLDDICEIGMFAQRCWCEWCFLKLYQNAKQWHLSWICAISKQNWAELILEGWISPPCPLFAAKKTFFLIDKWKGSGQITHWEDGLVVDANDRNIPDSNKPMKWSFDVRPTRCGGNHCYVANSLILERGCTMRILCLECWHIFDGGPQCLLRMKTVHSSCIAFACACTCAIAKMPKQLFWWGERSGGTCCCIAHFTAWNEMPPRKIKTTDGNTTQPDNVSKLTCFTAINKCEIIIWDVRN